MRNFLSEKKDNRIESMLIQYQIDIDLSILLSFSLGILFSFLTCILYLINMHAYKIYRYNEVALIA